MRVDHPRTTDCLDRPDRGDVLVGWLARLFVIFAIVAVVGIDGVTVGTAKVSISDQANSAAEAARDNWATSHDVQTAYTIAVQSAQAADPANVIAPQNFRVTSTGEVTLTMTRPLHTLVAHYLPVAAFKTATASADATPVS